MQPKLLTFVVLEVRGKVDKNVEKIGTKQHKVIKIDLI